VAERAGEPAVRDPVGGVRRAEDEGQRDRLAEQVLVVVHAFIVPRTPSGVKDATSRRIWALSAAKEGNFFSARIALRNFKVKVLPYRSPLKPGMWTSTTSRTPPSVGRTPTLQAPRRSPTVEPFTLTRHTPFGGLAEGETLMFAVGKPNFFPMPSPRTTRPRSVLISRP